MDTPTEKKKAKLTSEEQRYAARLNKAKDVKSTPAPEPKKK